MKALIAGILLTGLHIFQIQLPGEFHYPLHNIFIIFGVLPVCSTNNAELLPTGFSKQGKLKEPLE